MTGTNRSLSPSNSSLVSSLSFSLKLNLSNQKICMFKSKQKRIFLNLLPNGNRHCNQNSHLMTRGGGRRRGAHRREAPARAMAPSLWSRVPLSPSDTNAEWALRTPLIEKDQGTLRCLLVCRRRPACSPMRWSRDAGSVARHHRRQPPGGADRR